MSLFSFTVADKPETELEKLQVARVDAVEDPATGRSFIITKSEDTAELRANIEKLAKKTDEVLRKIHKSSPKLSDEAVVTSLNELSTLLGTEKDVKFEYAKKEEGDKPSDAPATEATKPEDDKDKVETPETPATEAAKSAPTVEEIADAVIKKLETKLQKDDGKEKSKPASQQVQAGDDVKKSKKPDLGEGLFESVVFSQE